MNPHKRFTIVIEANRMFSKLILDKMREALQQESVTIRSVHEVNCTMTVSSQSHTLEQLNGLVQKVTTQVRQNAGYRFTCSVTAEYV